jgi:hypothetical protein
VEQEDALGAEKEELNKNTPDDAKRQKQSESAPNDTGK